MRSFIFTHVQQIYNTVPEYPWTNMPNYAVLRHSRNKKWYAVIMTLPKATLGIVGGGSIEAVNVKATRDVIEQIPYASGFLPAYHMNKKHWMTILLDGTVPREIVCKFIDDSYQLTAR